MSLKLSRRSAVLLPAAIAAPALAQQRFGNMRENPPGAAPILPFERYFEAGDYAALEDIAVALDGSYFVTGIQGMSRYVSHAGRDERSRHMYFGHIDTAGNLLRGNNVGPPQGAIALFDGESLVEMSSGDVLIGGNAPMNGLNLPILTRMSPDGRVVWQKILASPPSQEIYKVVRFSGQYLVFARTAVSPDYQKLPRKTWLALVDDDGNIAGQSLFEGASHDAAAAPGGGFIISLPDYLVRINEAGEEVSRTPVSWPGFRMVVTNDAIYLLGNTTPDQRRYFKPCVARLDHQFKEVWRKTYDVKNLRLAHAGYGVALQGGDLVFTMGGYRDYGEENVAMLQRITPAGDVVWQNAYPRSDEPGIGSRFAALKETAAGGIVVVGSAFSGVRISRNQNTRLIGRGWILQIDPNNPG